MRKVLIVDDEVNVRLAFKNLLEQRNYIIKQARNQAEAIEALKNEIFDVLLLDIILPPDGWKTGFQILEKKKKIALNAATPVIIVSGKVNSAAINQRVSEIDSIVKIFDKPVESTDLLKAIDKVCGS
ncbi:MAG: response regulator [Calditrichaeota bacterium]|nr:response regulator [Calditrichota bacterium]